MSEQNSPQTEPSLPRQGPGDRLQSARISSGMSIEEIAGKMHLSTSILISLEQNNFDDITAPIFVKGYLRAYSRLVNINEDEIIQQYCSYYMDCDPPISSTSNTSPEINSDDTRVKWMTYFIILCLATLLSVWWWNRYQQAPETVSLDSNEKLESSTELTQFDALPQGAQQIEQAEAVATETELSLQQESSTMGQALDAAIEQTQQQTTTAPATSESAEEMQQSVTAEVIEQPAVVEKVTSESTSNLPTGQQQTSPAKATDALEIVVNADTWASIKDADGKKLLKDLLRAGESYTLRGKTPINVFLGNGYGVTMKYQGEVIDLSGVIKSNNTARIKIGQ